MKRDTERSAQADAARIARKKARRKGIISQVEDENIICTCRKIKSISYSDDDGSCFAFEIKVQFKEPKENEPKEEEKE